MPAPTDLRALKLVLTAACNLSCSYCYQNDKKARRIEWGVVQSALDRLLASSRSEVEVLFIGGEPLLEFPVIERAVAYLAARKRDDLSIQYAVITNGLLLGERQLDFLISHRFGVQLSFDGVPEAQLLRGKNTFDRLDRLLDELRWHHPAFYIRLRVNTTLTPETIRWLPASVEYFLLEKRIHDLTITPTITGANAWSLERIKELDEAFEQIYSTCLERYRLTEDVPLQVFQRTGDSSSPARDDLPMCRIGGDRLDSVAIDVDGQAHGCLMFVESYQTFPTVFLKSRVEALRLGDIRSREFGDRVQEFPKTARAQEIFNHRELKYSSYRRCAECEYLSDCSVCPMSIGRNDREADPRKVPDFYCAYNLVSLKYRARFPQLRSLAERLAGPVAM